MSLPIVFLPEARTEYDEAYDWYEAQSPGLGNAFGNRVEDVLKQVAATPEMHQMIHKDARRAVVRKFPYSVIYRLLPGQVLVIAIFHGKRNPKVWQERI